MKVNPVEAGLEGWDTLGSVTKKGDSWFTGTKPGTSITAAGHRRHDGGPRRIYFLCAIHPGMQGSIKSLPGGLATRLEVPQIRPAWGAELSSAPWAAARSPRRCRSACARGACCPAGGARRVRRRPAPFRAPLPIPRVLDDAQLTIPIREAEVQVLPGPKTRMWTYGGTFPGPTIRRPAGQRTAVTFHHQLPRCGRAS